MNRMKLLVGFLTIMVLGGLLGTDEWNWGLSTDGQDLDSDSTWMSIQCNNSAMDDGERLKDDSDSIMLKEYTSPIISTSEKPMKSFYRYKKERNAEFSSRCHFSFSADFPKSTVKNKQLIRSWLAERAVKTLSKDMSYNVKDYSDQQIEKYTSNLFFSFKKDEFSTDDTACYPIEAFFELNLQARVSNNRFVTYQECTNEYGGGIHGYYTERLVSYDHVHRQEIDFRYLFVEHAFDKIVDLLVDEAEGNPNYREWKPDIKSYVFDKDEEGHPTGKVNLPQPGLSENGVVFSFQPYEISCFAAGTFHFTIPYERLKPYLTDRAKWCINMGCERLWLEKVGA